MGEVQNTQGDISVIYGRRLEYLQRYQYELQLLFFKPSRIIQCGGASCCDKFFIHISQRKQRIHVLSSSLKVISVCTLKNCCQNFLERRGFYFLLTKYTCARCYTSDVTFMTGSRLYQVFATRVLKYVYLLFFIVYLQTPIRIYEYEGRESVNSRLSQQSFPCFQAKIIFSSLSSGASLGVILANPQLYTRPAHVYVSFQHIRRYTFVHHIINVILANPPLHHVQHMFRCHFTQIHSYTFAQHMFRCHFTKSTVIHRMYNLSTYLGVISPKSTVFPTKSVFQFHSFVLIFRGEAKKGV